MINVSQEVKQPQETHYLPYRIIILCHQMAVETHISSRITHPKHSEIGRDECEISPDR